MKIEQKKWTPEAGWKQISTQGLPGVPQLVLVFGGSAIVKEQKNFDDVKLQYPNSHIIMMSTAGEILDTVVSDGTLSLTAIYFEKTTVQFLTADIDNATQSLAVGEKLGKDLPKEKLVHTMVFSDGLKVNGTALVDGITSQLPAGTSLTGGLVGDGPDFKHTYVGLDEVPKEGKVVVVGFYGDSLKVSFGSMGGWDVFGPERQRAQRCEQGLRPGVDVSPKRMFAEINVAVQQMQGEQCTHQIFPNQIAAQRDDQRLFDAMRRRNGQGNDL